MWFDKKQRNDDFLKCGISISLPRADFVLLWTWQPRLVSSVLSDRPTGLGSAHVKHRASNQWRHCWTEQVLCMFK